MTRIVYIILGLVLVLFGIAKAGGLLYVLWTGQATPPSFGTKQIIYAVLFVAAGAGLLIAARQQAKRGELDV
jgi:hypothetical protein